MKFATVVVTLASILLVAAWLLEWNASATANAGEITQKPVLGDLDLRSPAGEQVSLIPYVGRKAIVVVFWATWCPICKKEVPHLNQLNSNPLVKVIGVNEGESLAKIRDFVVSNRVAYEVVVDPKAVVAKTFGVPGMPYCVIIGTSGNIEYRASGLPQNLDSYLNR